MSQSATRSDINDVLGVLDVMMSRIDERFTKLEKNDQQSRDQIRKILDGLDSLVKRQEISEDERLVMGHQLERLDQNGHMNWQKRLATN